MSCHCHCNCHCHCPKNKSWFPVHFALVAMQLCVWGFRSPSGIDHLTFVHCDFHCNCHCHCYCHCHCQSQLCRRQKDNSFTHVLTEWQGHLYCAVLDSLKIIFISILSSSSSLSLSWSHLAEVTPVIRHHPPRPFLDNSAMIYKPPMSFMFHAIFNFFVNLFIKH